MADEVRIITVKRGTTEHWKNQAVPLEVGEPGYDITTKQLKVGDGITMFPDLDSLGGGNGDVYIATGLKVLAAYDELDTFDLAGPLSAVEGRLAVGGKVKIAGKVAKITQIAEQEDAPAGEVSVVYVTLDKAVLSAADAGAEIGRGTAMVTMQAIGGTLAPFLTPQIFDKPGTYQVTVPEGVTKMRIKKAAAGGGGGSGGGLTAIPSTGEGTPGVGAGAGAGDAIVDLVIDAKPGDVVTIIVGAGGDGGTAGSLSAPGGTGKNGGNTIIMVNGDVVHTLIGGKAPNRTSANYAYRHGGLAGGDMAQDGEDAGGVLYQGGNGGNNLVGIGGIGGTGIAVGRQRGRDGVEGGGGGGGGGHHTTASRIGAGGDGGDGVVEIVWEVAA